MTDSTNSYTIHRFASFESLNEALLGLILSIGTEYDDMALDFSPSVETRAYLKCMILDHEDIAPSDSLFDKTLGDLVRQATGDSNPEVLAEQKFGEYLFALQPREVKGHEIPYPLSLLAQTEGQIKFGILESGLPALITVVRVPV